MRLSTEILIGEEELRRRVAAMASAIAADTPEGETLSVLADPEVEDHGAALEELVARYRARPEAALPSVPKDMDILYDHAYSFGFRSGYADLDGFMWAGHWYRLAATEPFTDLPMGADRLAGLDTIQTRYFAKLSYGEPPEFFPSEIPLAPAISPGLIWESAEAAMIWDNLSMYLEVLSDVLASPNTPDVEGAIEATTNFFMDPELAVTDQDEWEIMALRHGIFYQGGYPLAVMLESERNVGGHADEVTARCSRALHGRRRSGLRRCGSGASDHPGRADVRDRVRARAAVRSLLGDVPGRLGRRDRFRGSP